LSTRAANVVLAVAAIVAAGCGPMRSVRSFFAHDAGERTPPAQMALATAAAAPGAGDETPVRGEREVEFPAVAESVTSSLFPSGAAARFADARVPVLAPASMSRDQAGAFLSSFRPTSDGFFARLGLEDFDVVMNGTRLYAVAPEGAGAPRRDAAGPQFSQTENGMSVSFNRFGADYSIDFVCRGSGGEEGSDCVTEAKAAEFVQRLVPVGGDGR